jgi:hypothetical protein
LGRQHHQITSQLKVTLSQCEIITRLFSPFQLFELGFPGFAASSTCDFLCLLLTLFVDHPDFDAQRLTSPVGDTCFPWTSAHVTHFQIEWQDNGDYHSIKGIIMG